MLTYPIELNLNGRQVVVVGGGRVALRKIAGLVEAGARVRAVSLDFAPEILEYQDITCDRRAYEPDCLEGACLVFACTSDYNTNALVAADARSRGILCNVADDPGSCDFFLPAVARQGDLAVSVSTGGASPGLAALLRDRLASQLGPEWGILVEELGRARSILKVEVADPRVRRQIMDTLCTECSIKLLATRNREAWRAWFERVKEHRLTGRQ